MPIYFLLTNSNYYTVIILPVNDAFFMQIEQANGNFGCVESTIFSTLIWLSIIYG